MTASPLVELADLLSPTRYLLLDFDGPICAMFAGQSTRAIVVRLLDILCTNHVQLPAPIAHTTDPFDVLRYAATISTALTQRVERSLRAAEVNAARTATPTPHAREAIHEWRTTSRIAAVVSNNSLAAVETYLTAHSIQLDLVVARTNSDPTLLKPSPYLVTTTMQALDDEPAAYALVGDSVSDIIAARRAGISSIGYANRDSKRQSLTDAGADIVIEDMTALAHAAIASA
jgi:phosphoglycolate phosphatase